MTLPLLSPVGETLPLLSLSDSWHSHISPLSLPIIPPLLSPSLSFPNITLYKVLLCIALAGAHDFLPQS